MASRSIIITGAGGGVGAACARRFAQGGDRVLLADKDEDQGRAVADELESNGADVAFVHANPASRLDVHNIIAEALDAFGRIDALAHMAQRRAAAPFLELDEDDFDALIKENLRGAFLVNQAVARQFVKQGDADGAGVGAIVNVAAIDAVAASADRVAFAASQGGVRQLTRSIALALSPQRIRVNAIGLGAIKGEMDEDGEAAPARPRAPLGRIGSPEEAAEAAFFLASAAASYITGQMLYVDGGMLARAGAEQKPKSDETKSKS